MELEEMSKRIDLLILFKSLERYFNGEFDDDSFNDGIINDMELNKMTNEDLEEGIKEKLKTLEKEAIETCKKFYKLKVATYEEFQKKYNNEYNKLKEINKIYKICKEDRKLAFKTYSKRILEYVEDKINDILRKDILKDKKELQNLKDKYNSKLEEMSQKYNESQKSIKEYQNKILEIMGIFLSIFSLIRVNLSFFSKIKDISIWNILLLVIVINVSLSDAIKVIFSIIRKEKVETIVEKIFRKIITCIKEKTK